MNEPEQSHPVESVPESHSTAETGANTAGSARPTQEHALARTVPPTRTEQSSGLQRAMAAARVVLPVVQKVLPLLDGNVASAVANLLGAGAQRSSSQANLAPVESALTKLHVDQRDLRSRVEEQSDALKHLSNHLDTVKETADRTAREQQDIVNDLADIRHKVKLLAWVGLGLLAASLIVNIILFLRVARG